MQSAATNVIDPKQGQRQGSHYSFGLPPCPFQRLGWGFSISIHTVRIRFEIEEKVAYAKYRKIYIKEFKILRL